MICLGFWHGMLGMVSSRFGAYLVSISLGGSRFAFELALCLALAWTGMDLPNPLFWSFLRVSSGPLRL